MIHEGQSTFGMAAFPSSFNMHYSFRLPERHHYPRFHLYSDMVDIFALEGVSPLGVSPRKDLPLAGSIEANMIQRILNRRHK